MQEEQEPSFSNLVCGAIFREVGASELQAACNKIGGCKVGEKPEENWVCEDKIVNFPKKSFEQLIVLKEKLNDWTSITHKKTGILIYKFKGEHIQVICEWVLL